MNRLGIIVTSFILAFFLVGAALSVEKEDKKNIDKCEELVSRSAKWDYEVVSLSEGIRTDNLTKVEGEVKFQNGYGAWKRKNVSCSIWSDKENTIRLE